MTVSKEVKRKIYKINQLKIRTSHYGKTRLINKMVVGSFWYPPLDVFLKPQSMYNFTFRFLLLSPYNVSFEWLK